MSTVSRRFPLMTLHMEKTSADVCFVGRPLHVNARRGTFVTISPAAQWDRDEPLTVPWADLTRLDIGGAYEEALALVAGPLEKSRA